MIRKSLCHQKGYTLSETVIYIGIVSLITVGIVSIAIQLVSIKSKADSLSTISGETSNLFEKMTNDIRNCDSFAVVEESELEIVNNGTTSGYRLEDSKVYFNDGTDDYQLTSNLIKVTRLSFVDWTSVNSDNLVHIELDVKRGEIDEKFQVSIHKR